MVLVTLAVIGFLALFFISVAWLSNEKFFTVAAVWAVVLGILAWLNSDYFLEVYRGIDFKRFFLVHIPLWLLVGVVISFINWIIHVYRFGDYIRDIKNSIKRRHNSFDLSNEVVRAEFVRQFNQSSHDNRSASFMKRHLTPISANDSREQVVVAITPKTADHSYRLTWWAILWPLVVVDIVTDGLIERLSKILAKVFDTLFGRISRRIISKSLDEN